MSILCENKLSIIKCSAPMQSKAMQSKAKAKQCKAMDIGKHDFD